MDSSLSLRIASIFILAIASFLGISIPLYAPENFISDRVFLMFKSLSAGVMVGLALVSYLFIHFFFFIII